MSAAPQSFGQLKTRVTIPAPRRGRGRATIVAPPLGSLTQRTHRSEAACRGCGSVHVTRLSMSLTDGTPVDFTSCHRCEHRTWEHADGELSVDGVLQRARKE
jgi:hypothetical protein